MRDLFHITLFLYYFFVNFAATKYGFRIRANYTNLNILMYYANN
jgi:hypothetical protein